MEALVHTIRNALLVINKATKTCGPEDRRIIEERLNKIAEALIRYEGKERLIRIKALNILNLSPLLEEIAKEVMILFHLEVVTSAHRVGDKGVHGTIPVRGLDLRCHDDFIGRRIEEHVNNSYIYDFKRPDKRCCIYHDVGKGKHIHLQVHPNTKKRSNDNDKV